MFAGIIQHTTEIVAIQDGVFTVRNPFGDVLEVGQSISHDGACMSVTERDSEQYSFFAMQESFDKTNFGSKSVGDQFNVELCMRLQDTVDGHFVTWHIDTTAVCEKWMEGPDGSKQLWVRFDPQYDELVIPKGSVALNGVSLTVVDVEPGLLSVWLIPLTLDKTNLSDLEPGDRLNIEFDMLGKYVVKQMKLRG